VFSAATGDNVFRAVTSSVGTVILLLVVGMILVGIFRRAKGRRRG
jgi:hypothetical protein